MSTKISHGYRLRPGIDPFAFIARVREVMDPARDLADAKLLAGLYAEVIDREWFAGRPIASGAGFSAWREWYLEQSKMNPMDRDRDPNEFGVEIGRDPVTGRCFLLCIAYNPDLRDAFDAMDEVEEYGYWNSTDELPEGVTPAEWEERRQLWERLIPHSGRSSLLKFHLRHPSDDGVGRLLEKAGQDTAPVYASLPSDGQRATTVAMDAYSSYLAREKGIDTITAATHVAFGRSADLSQLVDAAVAHLLAVTPELVTFGTDGAVIGPRYSKEMAAACAALYELDREALEDR